MNSSDEAVQALRQATDEAAQRLEVALASPRKPGKNSAIALFAAAVRAEAVADERRRAAVVIRQARTRQAKAFGPEPSPYDAGRLDGLEDAARIVAGSVPVATPPAGPVSFQRGGDVVTTVAPSRPVTCEHGKTDGHEYLVDKDLWYYVWCPGPVPEPKEG